MANSSSTATDVPRQDEDAVDPAKAAAFKLDPYMVALLWQEPFFAVLMRQMDRVRDDKFPTAGVTVKNGSPTLIFNGGWLSTLEDKRILGLLKHEAYHLVYRHVVDRRKAPLELRHRPGDQRPAGPGGASQGRTVPRQAADDQAGGAGRDDAGAAGQLQGAL
jgi:hypothetical protein